MKPLIRATLLGVALLAGSAGLAMDEVQKRVKQIPSGALNVRAGPGTSYADIGDISSGTIINVLGYDTSGRWAIIDWQGQIAYVARAFLTDINQAPVINDSLGMHRVSGISANDPDGGLVVRTGPGTNFGRLLVLPEGMLVNIVEISPDRKWSRGVFSDGGTGWMRNRYLRTEAQPQPGSTSIVTTPSFALPVYDFPNDTSPQIAVLAPNTPVAVLEQLHSDWLKVSAEGQEGYIHGTGTTPGGGTTTAQGMQLGLTCAGTEPFWTFQINTDATTSFEDIGSQGNPITGTISNIGGTAYPYSFQAGQISGQLNNQQCSDGMSDITYPFELFLNVTMNGTMQAVQGCCLLQ